MPAAASPFSAVTALGALIAPAQLARIAAGQAGGQDEASYGVPKGLALRDELARYFRIGQAQWRAFRAAEAPGLAATARFVADLLRQTLGFDDVAVQPVPLEAGGRSFPIALLAGPVPIAVAPATDPLDGASEALSAHGRRRSAAALLQEFLNAEPSSLWGLACNGLALRLARDNPSLTRPAFIEFDLAAIFDDEAYADFVALFLLLHRSRFAANDEACRLEQWRQDGAKAGAVAREKLRDGVEAALQLLGQGFLEHPANVALAARLRSGDLPLPDYFASLLRLVYRLIFLLAAEERDLLHPATANASARELYARGYSVRRLRDKSVRRATWDRHHDAWEGLTIVMEALGRGETRLGLPALGGVFAAGGLADLDGATLGNATLLEAIFRLAWLREPSGPVPVDWRNMESEELGSVYEGLLELVPRLERGGAVFAFAEEGAETKGNVRKVSGSYYTPDSLVQVLLDSALNPVLDSATAQAEDPAAALLSLRVVDPACGSGHFLLAAARRIGARLADVRAAGSATPDDYRHALREVVSACIHGVDRNPMAVELSKVALWIETVEPGKPLGFLDANIRCGDSLLGVFDTAALKEGIPDEAYKPLTGDDPATTRLAGRENRAQKSKKWPDDLIAHASAAALAREARAVQAMPENDLADLTRKARAYDELRAKQGWGARRLACDLYVAAFLRAKRPRGGDGPAAQAPDRVPLTADMRVALAGGQPDAPTAALAVDLASEARAFHWPLEFPTVMAAGGFDCVLGNPPWDVLQLGEEEYFAQRMPEIAELAGAARKRAIARLEVDHPAIFQTYIVDKRRTQAANEFARVSGRFDLSARGKVNTYALFAELFTGLSGPRGRAGVILPTGIATDATTAPYFAYLVEQGRLDALLSFENEEMVFPGIHHAMKFCLLSLRPQSNATPSDFVFYARQVSALEDPDRRFTLSPAQIAAINPNTKTAPVFRSRRDAELTAKIYGRVPVLIDETKPSTEGNPWGVSFRQGLFNMTSDSGLFRTADELAAEGAVRDGADWIAPGGARFVPLYEAKMIHQFDHRWATYDGPETRDCTTAEKADPAFEPAPRYWVPEREVLLRTAVLPKGLLQALRSGDEAFIALAMATELFAWRLAATDGEFTTDVFAVWRDFAESQPFARGFAPTQMGLCGESGAMIGRGASNALPAEPIDRITDGPRTVTAWYAVDPKKLAAFVERARSSPFEFGFAPRLETQADAARFAEECLEAAAPKWLMGWRDITNATNERTVIADAFPRVGVGHKLPLFFVQHPIQLAICLDANMSSIVLDFVARQKIGGTSLTYFYLKQFAVLPPSAYANDDLAFIVPRVLELTYTSHALASFARDLGYDGPPFPWDENRRAQLRAELDVWYARAYGLTSDELRYILYPADVMGAAYPSETFRVLKKNELARFGEYRTGRLVLEAWDRMEGGQDTVVLPVFVDLSSPESLPDGAWAWPPSIQPRDRLRYAAQHALWQMDSSRSGERARFVIAGLAEPALLTPLLAANDRDLWLRLMGSEARPTQGMARLRPQINEAWRSVFGTLIASGQLEERADGLWARGRHFNPAGLDASSADAQRAAFAIRAVQAVNSEHLAAAVAPEDNVVWTKFGGGHSG